MLDQSGRPTPGPPKRRGVKSEGQVFDFWNRRDVFDSFL